MGKLKTYGKAYGAFLAMVLFTAFVVRPAVNKYNVPLLKGNI